MKTTRSTFLTLAVLVTPCLSAHATEPGSYPRDFFGEGPTAAQSEPTFAFDLQYRPRAEKTVDGNIRFDPNQSNFALSHRARLGANVWYRGVRGLVSFQNARRGGVRLAEQEAGLFEAYIETGSERWKLRVGSQMITFATGRLLTAPLWSQRSRTLDAIRWVYEHDGLLADVFAAWFNDGVLRGMYGTNVEARLGSIYLGLPILAESNAGIATDRRIGAVQTFYRVSPGLTLRRPGTVSFEAEVYGQIGEIDGDYAPFGGLGTVGRVQAFMAHANVGVRVSEYLHPVLWVDYLSGDGNHDDDNLGAFDTVVGYRRRFYGRADRFIRIPRQTSNGGLIDVALMNEGKLGPGTLFLEGHGFAFPEENLSGQSGVVGVEGDARYRVELVDGLTLELAYSYFRHVGDFKKAPSETADLVTRKKLATHYGYVQLDLQLP